MSHIINILAGPTAVGKTALALEWATAHGAEIVNADALLFYRGMDIGTAKPSPEELARVPHWLINIRPVHQSYSIKEYVTDAQAAVADIIRRDKKVLIVGGSGFYLRSYFAPVVDDLEPSPTIRAEVQQLEAQGGLTAMLDRLDTLNPEGTRQLDRNNPRRVARALERCLISGQTLAALETDFAAKPGPFDAYVKRSVLLLRGNDDLHARVTARTKGMLDAGLVDEVRRLKSWLEENPAAGSSIGYRETLAWLDAGEAQHDELSEAIQLSTRRLIAKQRKWFRNQFTPDLIIEGDADASALTVFQ
ncbi:tRNA (adenosine(37)-N6)-dimethylallyltransferase MiaA [Cerasicoccus arenae]|uniref:tRNA (adenosine(37)-N6)-dimethylallyltransferase MiaA n=1 Tax=Cerasicoccus arenae TaxID=424488 RepID=UPI00190455C6|nr:tRNA (adenosine(37)-N6)-dimethylallyltransferase MiaA [Cerasicoccus arenae]MBK1859044.1 tRNA (adenosine(37)-N6)-dimethylallyltransferase MiaA [Cerasicoccus arenae]